MTELLTLPKVDYGKLKISLLGQLMGAKMTLALAAFDLAEPYSKDETRKDGVTPEFEHQVRIAAMALLLKGLDNQFLELLLCVILLHDLMEDYDISKAEIMQTIDDAARLRDPQYQGIVGRTVYEAVWCMTKTYRGKKKSPDHVFSDIANNALASLAKGLDRINNFQTMKDAFTPAKQVAYIQEGLKWFLPMLKEARKRFAHHMEAYMMVTTILKMQIELLVALNQDTIDEMKGSQA